MLKRVQVNGKRDFLIKANRLSWCHNPQKSWTPISQTFNLRFPVHQGSPRVPPCNHASAIHDRKNRELQVPLAVPYKALGKFPKTLYGTTGDTCSARFFCPVMLLLSFFLVCCMSLSFCFADYC